MTDPGAGTWPVAPAGPGGHPGPGAARRTSKRIVLVDTATFRQARQLVPFPIPSAWSEALHVPPKRTTGQG